MGRDGESCILQTLTEKPNHFIILPANVSENIKAAPRDGPGVRLQGGEAGAFEICLGQKMDQSASTDKGASANQLPRRRMEMVQMSYCDITRGRAGASIPST